MGLNVESHLTRQPGTPNRSNVVHLTDKAKLIVDGIDGSDQSVAGKMNGRMSQTKLCNCCLRLKSASLFNSQGISHKLTRDEFPRIRKIQSQ